MIAIPLVIWGWDRYQDRQIKVTVNAATHLYASDVDAAYGSFRPVRSLKPGEKLKVIRATYGKDYGALLVKAEDGRSGWIAIGQDGLTIHQRK